MLQNAYFPSKIGADTAENEQQFAKILLIGRRCDQGPALGEMVKLLGDGDEEVPQRAGFARGLHPRDADRREGEQLREHTVPSRIYDASRLRRRMNIELKFPPNSAGLVLGCIDADFSK